MNGALCPRHITPKYAILHLNYIISRFELKTGVVGCNASGHALTLIPPPCFFASFGSEKINRDMTFPVDKFNLKFAGSTGKTKWA